MMFVNELRYFFGFVADGRSRSVGRSVSDAEISETERIAATGKERK